MVAITVNISTRHFQTKLLHLFVFSPGKTYGDERATPVLCVHGRADNLETFTNLLPLLPRNFYYVCIDLPCHGQSAHADKGYVLDLQWYSLCVKRVIDHFKWPKLCIMGHSLGGQIGFILAALYPELILKLVIVEALMFYHLPPKNVAKATRYNILDSIMKLEKRNAFVEAPTYSLFEFVNKMRQTRGTEADEEQIKAIALRNLLKVGEDQYKTSNDQRTKFLVFTYLPYEALVNLAEAIKCPTLIILGKNYYTRPDEVISNSPEHNIKSVTFEFIKGDHDVHLVHPREVASLIAPFLSGEFPSKL